MSALGRGGWGLVLAVSVLGAVVARWPLSVQPDAWPLDPNSGLHALVVEALAAGSFDRVPALAYPEGAPIRLVGLPALLLGVPLEPLLGPAPALEVARTIWLALQGVAVGGLAAALGAGRRGAGVAAALAVVNPFVLHASGNGQHENVVLAPLALAAWVGLRAGAPAGVGGLGALALWAALATGVLGASSPYHLVPGGLLLLAAAGTRGRAALVATLAGTVTAGLALSAYYAGALEAGSAWGRPRTAVRVTAGLADLVWPRATHLYGPPSVRGVGERVADALQALPVRPVDATWPWTEPFSAPYLGLVLLGLGLLGLRGARGALRALALAGAASVVLALGDRLALFGGRPTGIPLPWALVLDVPGVGALSSTTRFLSGAVLVLVLGAGVLAARARWAVALVPLAVLDATLVAPVEWPVRAARPDVALLVERVPEGPVGVWPDTATVPPQLHALLALAVGRPLVEPEGPAEAFRERLDRTGASAVLWVTPMQSGDWAVVPVEGADICVGGLCLRTRPKPPAPRPPWDNFRPVQGAPRFGPPSAAAPGPGGPTGSAASPPSAEAPPR